MRRLFHILASLLFLLLVPAGCKEENKVVLDKEEMASLMADIHMAEAAVDLNYQRFPSDSSRMALKQSIFRAHGVTQEQVDSSFSWYGYHIEEYMLVYDRTLEILKERQKDLLSTSTERIAVAGDSVDVWPMSQHMEFSRRSPSRILTFALEADSNWHDKDVFSLNMNVVGAQVPLIARMAVEYADGTSGFNLTTSRDKGRTDVAVRVDSARNPVRIVGYIIASPKEDETVRIDSISLTRMRAELAKRYFSMRRFDYGIKQKPMGNKLLGDTAALNADSDNSGLEELPADATGSQPGSNHQQGMRHSAHRNHRDGIRRSGAEGKQSSTAPANRGNAPAQSGNSTQVAPKSRSAESAAQKAKRERDEMFHNASRKK